MRFETTRLFRALAVATVWTALIGAVHVVTAAEPDEKAAIRTLIGKTWDKPDAKVEIDPVVIAGTHAVAGWTQGQRGGRALLRKRDASWGVVLCSGDPLRHAAALIEAGVPEAEAQALASGLAAAEQQTDPQRVKLFSTFEGVMRMDDEHSGNHHSHH
jgi:hypothetical protein